MTINNNITTTTDNIILPEIKRTMYLGDIHSSDYFVQFINKYNDGHTKFISLGDLFDRGNSTFENITLIMDLHKKGLYDMILGNHDLFFIFGIGFSPEYDGFLLKRVSELQTTNSTLYKKYLFLGETNLNDLMWNQGDKTVNSILEKSKSWMFDLVSPLTKDEQNKRLNDIAEFLWDNFEISKIDECNNLLVHGGIPILSDGTIVNVKINNIMTNNGLDLLEKINIASKNLDIDVLEWISHGLNGEYNVHNTIYDLFENKMVINPEDISRKSLFFEMSKDMTCTRFDNSKYLNEIIGPALKKELKIKDINALICGHWGNRIPNEWFNDINSKYWSHLLGQKQTVIRLDRSGAKYDKLGYGNFGVLTIDNKGNYIRTFDILLDDLERK